MYVKLARSAAEYYVRRKRILPTPIHVPRELAQQRACFVGAFENPGRHVRFFYGSPLPSQPTLAQEIIMNTCRGLTSASSGGVRQADLVYLQYGVSVLGPLERVSAPEHLNPHRFGLFVRSDMNKAIYVLPGRVGIETGADQIATALREADIDLRRESVNLYRFLVRTYE